jgi:hypothetical protein
MHVGNVGPEYANTINLKTHVNYVLLTITVFIKDGSIHVKIVEDQVFASMENKNAHVRIVVERPFVIMEKI